MNASRTAFTFDSPQNVQALTYIAGLAKAGYLKFAAAGCCRLGRPGARATAPRQ